MKNSLFGSIVVLLLLLIVVMWLPHDSCIFMRLTGEESKLELIKLIGWGISGVIAILGVMGLFQRATALDKQNEMTENGHIQERFNKATEHLGHGSMSVRIAAFNAFCHLVEIKPEWRKNIFDILCAHLRSTTTDKNYKKEGETSGPPESMDIKPTEEIQSLLNILFKQGKLENKDIFIFDGLVANLEGVYLQGANLRDANLRSAKLRGANLQRARLHRANLQNARLQKVKLQYAFLRKAKLKNAKLWNTKLQHANLQDACLRGAELKRQNPDRKADINKADLTGATINKKTKMPDNWKSIVKRNKDDETGVIEED